MKWIIIACATLCVAIARQSNAGDPPSVAMGTAPSSSVVSLIVGGSAVGVPADSPALHVDANLAASPLAGVGSVFIDSPPFGDGLGFLCSGCAIHGFTLGKRVVRDYVLMAAHCLDFAGGLTPDSMPTGDGLPDVAPQNVTFVLNAGGDFTSLITASQIILHPNWHGFLNTLGPEGTSVNDDVALLRLSSPVPAGVPTYNLATSVSGVVELIRPTGYGASGSPSGITVAASFNVKRSGFNHADLVFSDDELSGQLEIFEADFDGPDGTTNAIDLGAPGFNASIEGTLGNNVESTLGPGDSGGPSLLSVFNTGALSVGSDGQPIVYGINTFGSADAPAYGSLFGGMLVGRYASWIDSVIVPEPTSAALALVGWLPIACLAFHRRVR